MIAKPENTEYAAFAESYVSLSRPYDDVVALLTDLSRSTPALFSSLPAEKHNYAYAEGKWTLKEMLLHVIDSERVFAYRAFCISRGEQQNLPGFEQDDYARYAEAAGRSMESLLEEYSAVRAATLCLLRSLSTQQANRVGQANGRPASVRALAYILAGHELYHLNILRERYL